jgi:hypothetical protein
VAGQPRNLGHSLRNIAGQVQDANRHGGRGSRIGVALILAGAALLVVAVVGALIVNL